MLEIPREREFKKVKVRMLAEVKQEFDLFVEFAQEHQPHASADNVLQYVVEEFFGSTRQDVVAFREWQEGGDEADKAGQDADEGGKKAEAQEEAEEGQQKEESKATGAEKGGESGQNKQRRPKAGADETGEMKIPRPKSEKRASKAKVEESRRRIERRATGE